MSHCFLFFWHRLWYISDSPFRILCTENIFFFIIFLLTLLSPVIHTKFSQSEGCISLGRHFCLGEIKNSAIIRKGGGKTSVPLWVSKASFITSLGDHPEATSHPSLGRDKRQERVWGRVWQLLVFSHTLSMKEKTKQDRTTCLATTNYMSTWS